MVFLTGLKQGGFCPFLQAHPRIYPFNGGPGQADEIWRQIQGRGSKIDFDLLQARYFIQFSLNLGGAVGTVQAPDRIAHLRLSFSR